MSNIGCLLMFFYIHLYMLYIFYLYVKESIFLKNIYNNHSMDAYILVSLLAIELANQLCC